MNFLFAPGLEAVGLSLVWVADFFTGLLLKEGLLGAFLVVSPVGVSDDRPPEDVNLGFLTGFLAGGSK